MCSYRFLIQEVNRNMTIGLIVISVLAVGLGFFSLSEATMGVGIIAIGAILGVYARLAQTDGQNNKLNAQLANLEQQMEIMKQAVNEIRDID